MEKRVGFISTRFATTDGVSLEVDKWAKVLTRLGHRVYYFAGLCDRPEKQSYVIPEAHFEHPEIKTITERSFGFRKRDPKLTQHIHAYRDLLKKHIYRFIQEFNLDLLIPENVLSLPLNIPLGLALTEVCAETGMPAIAHHHDFYWERQRFLITNVNDYLMAAFPPDLYRISHVVINSLASQQLSHRRGLRNVIIPNVYDFAHPPEPRNEKREAIRAFAGIHPQDPFILQPTRIVPRKWIERSIELVAQLPLVSPTLVISHASGDEGDDYFHRIQEYAEMMKVRLVFLEPYVGTPSEVAQKKKHYTIGDIYKTADLITYPSGYEGFGNAFLEAIYYQKPIVVNRYSTYITDIEPKGFEVIAFNGFTVKETLRQVENILSDEQKRRTMIDKNYALAQKYFSFELLENRLKNLIHNLNHL